jgi:2-amino-4-hydroxy-6-hydroxymethyldihydropteridine diphosphokinase
VRIEAVSRIVESEPWGPIPQGPYLNLVVRGRTRLPPADLLRIAHATEAKAGRVREARYGPRTLDVDLLFFGDVASDAPELTLPHPRWRERPFVYALLHEVAGNVTDPHTGVRIAELVPAGPLPKSLREVGPIFSMASESP